MYSQVEFTADSLKLDIVDLARTGNKLVSVSGRPEWMCQAVEVADPVTFTTPDTVLVSLLLRLHVYTYRLTIPLSSRSYSRPTLFSLSEL